MLLIDALRHLWERGHCPEHKVFGPEFLAWATRDMGKALIERYQQYQGLPITGVLTAETEARLTAPRCGHPDILAVSGQSAWAIKELAYWQEVSYPGVTPAELETDFALAVSRITAVCGLTMTPAASINSAHIKSGSGPIDGPWNVLALSELPPPNNVTLAMKQKYDVAETGLTRDQRQAMMAHELGHALGLGHAPPGIGALMEPVLGSFVAPQAWDTAQLQERYGVPGYQPPPGRPPARPPNPPTNPPVAPPVLPIAVTGTGEIIQTVKWGTQYTVVLGAPGRYMVMLVPLPPP